MGNGADGLIGLNVVLNVVPEEKLGKLNLYIILIIKTRKKIS